MNDYWVDVFSGGTRCGAGFLLTRQYALTAAHCLQWPKVAEGDMVTLSRRHGDSVEATVLRIDVGRDIALMGVNQTLDWTMRAAEADRCVKDHPWSAPYRPTLEMSELRGTVLTSPLPFQRSGGEKIEALELQVRQEPGDYAGYSGSPVQCEATGRLPPDIKAVVGMLIQQDPHRVREGEFTNVLFAITIAEAIGAFAELRALPQLARLMRRVLGGQPSVSTVGQVAHRNFAAARASIDEMRAMVEDGLLTSHTYAELVNEVVRMAASSTINASVDGA